MNHQPLLNRAKECLKQESDALLSLVDKVDESYLFFAKEMSACHGKFCFTGVGKSFYVANKISSSFSSLGYASFCIDPLNLLHGEMGAISEGDIVVAVSNSGETDILLNGIMALRERNVPILSIVGNNLSSLARLSKCFIAVPTSEAGPFGLVPSTSTTAMMAVGDALLCALTEMDELTIDSFKKFHPDGQLGKIMKDM